MYVTPECSESPALSRSTVEKQTTIHSFIWTWTIRRPEPCGNHGHPGCTFAVWGVVRDLCTTSLMAGDDTAATGKSAAEASELIEVWEKIYERFRRLGEYARSFAIWEKAPRRAEQARIRSMRLVLQKIFTVCTLGSLRTGA